MNFSSARLLDALFLGGFVSWLLVWSPFSSDKPATPCFLEFVAASPSAGTMTLRIDEGHGYADDRPSEVAINIRPDSRPSTLRLPVQPGRIRGLKQHVFGTPSLAVYSARLSNARGETLAIFPASSFLAGEDTMANRVRDALVVSPTQSGSNSFAFEIVPPSPLIVRSGNELSLPLWIGTWLAASMLIVLSIVLLSKRFGRIQVAWRGLKTTAQSRPILTLAAISLSAAIISSYPVVFGGKSFVSPNNQVHLLYFSRPTLPNIELESPEDVKGSDVAAIMWCHIPYTALVGQSLFENHELPLWNRYDCAGVPLLGQAQSMVGDPAGLLPLLAGSAWWAWDAKFVLAKAIFALGIGLCVRRITGNLGIAVITAVSSAWIGFFAFRFAHVAVFSVAYAPWILLPWLILTQHSSRRVLLWSGAGLLIANWVELNSGTAKESTMLILSMNGTGLLVLLSSNGTWHERARRASALFFVNVLFLLISAPLWLVFLDALRRSVTVYDVPGAVQLPVSLLLGFFDDIFTQDFTRLENHSHPSLNMFVLAGCLWFFAAARWRATPLARSLFLAAIPAFAFAFGIVPPTWIASTPFLGKIIHIHNTFGCVLLIQLTLLAAIGLSHLLEVRSTPEWAATWRRMLAGVVVLTALYLSFTQVIGSSADARFHIDPMLRSLFFLHYAPVALIGVGILPWLIRREAWIAAAVAFIIVHFRHGMYLDTKFDPYVMNPRTGHNLHADSTALHDVKTLVQREPYRSTGFSGTLSPGYNALVRMESIAGADALMNRHYYELCRAGNIAQIGWRIVVPENSVESCKPFYDLLNLRYYLRSPKEVPPSATLSVVGKSDLEIVESREAWPRAFFTNRIKSYTTLENFATLVSTGDGRPFAATQGSLLPIPASETVTPANGYHFTTNSTTFTVHADGPGVAVLSETFEEDNFRVTIDGKPAHYFRVNHAFKGVEIAKAGEYRITFSYWPKILTPALWLAATGLALGAGTFAFLLPRQGVSRDSTTPK